MQFLITFVAIFFLFTSLVQYGIRMHANRMAEAAAREAAVSTARFDGTTESGRATADDYLSTTGAIAITGSTVNVTRSTTEARVSVTVKIVPLAPWLADPITSVATAPVERFVP
ncbi:TadE/TadG family type IV pilus assembly protein [Brevibacterium sp. Mu109]|uniref:TadE/TadG family type IV pilus assembly protein n=1 Tax=Brevibacterium sp. Mu109 TaxID=1255669 RepID=UPI000C794199|nr:TadE/TadG family type IV pilus assembly protein [Brevibacterium sp. Mu109]